MRLARSREQRETASQAFSPARRVIVVAVMTRGGLALTLAVLVAACARPEAPVSVTSTPTPARLAESDAWSRVRTTLQGVPIIHPTWLPPRIDRSGVELRMGHAGPGDTNPLYEITYLTSSGETIRFALGPASDVAGSGIGTRVRNSSAVLSFDSSLSSDPAKRGPRRIRWQEGPYVLRIDTDSFTGDDLLHIAWSLDRTGAPAPATPYTRVKPGVCAIGGAPPEDTVRLLLSFAGGHDRHAVMDCFSVELLGERPGYGDWADLPTTRNVTLQLPRALGGRSVIGATWTFTGDPGGAWGQPAHQIFLLGLEDGVWRVYETATAMISPPP